MATATQKAQYLAQLQSVMTDIANVNTRARDLASMFVDREYDGAANDPITDADLAPFGLAKTGADVSVSSYHLGAAINLCQALNSLCAGQAVGANGAFPVALNKWRTA